MHKHSVCTFFAFTAFFAAVLLAFFCYRAFHVDPLYLYKKKSGYHFYKIDNMRRHIGGLIQAFDFDSIILGTSILENASAKQHSKLLGGKFVNLSMSGGTYYERSFVLDYALKKKPLKKIVYSLDRYYHYCPYTGSYSADNWAYLCSDNIWQKLKAYASKVNLKRILYKSDKGQRTSLDRPYAWMGIEFHTCRFGGLDNWVANQEKQGMGDFLRKTLPAAAQKAQTRSKDLKRDHEKERRAKEYVDKYVFSFAEAYPDTEFHMVFPPYWRFHYAEKRQGKEEDFALHQEIIRHVVNWAQRLDNVRIYGFEDCDFVDDIANYKDVTHYAPHINEYIAESIAADKHRLTSDNVESYLKRCDELAWNFDLQALAATVKQKLDAWEAKHKK